MAAKAIFVGGTGSHVGKSWVATALCRYLLRLGYRVAPFKAQNMSNNSAVCADGGEIGRAQAEQAAACGLEPHTDMNPILLKPTGTYGSQVILNGRPWKTLAARDYYSHFHLLRDNVLASYQRLSEQHDFVVIEGAGSITELNLKLYDLVNLGLARILNAPCILVADIDRGGVFASITGTFALLEADEAPLVRSFLINRFRGDRTLFSDGVPILEEKSGRPCLGVFPFLPDTYLDPEDSVSLEDGHPFRNCAASHEIHRDGRVAIVRLPHISNFTDFRLLPHAEYITGPVTEIFDTVILPGTKSTIEDMIWLQQSGLDHWIHRQYAAGSRIIGVCGGYQMLCERIVDPFNVESPVGECRGLALIDAETLLSKTKVTRNVSARTPSGLRFEAYEIHMGITTHRLASKPFATMSDGTEDGIRTGRITGTYLHGALENRRVLEDLLGHSIADREDSPKELHYDRLAGWFSEHVNHAVLDSQYGIQIRTTP